MLEKKTSVVNDMQIIPINYQQFNYVLFLHCSYRFFYFNKLNGCIQNEILSSFTPYCEYRHNDFIILNLLIVLEMYCFCNQDML